MESFNVGPSEFCFKDGAVLESWTISMAGGNKREVLASLPGGGECGCRALAFSWNEAGANGELNCVENIGRSFFGAPEKLEGGFRVKFVQGKARLPESDFSPEGFYVEYLFEEFAFELGIGLLNASKTRVPWDAGADIFFKVPWHSGCTRQNYRVLHDARAVYGLGENGKLSVLEPGSDLSEAGDVVLAKLKSAMVKIGLKSGEEDITVRIGDGKRPSSGMCVILGEREGAFKIGVRVRCPALGKSGRFVEPGQEACLNLRVSLE